MIYFIDAIFLLRLRKYEDIFGDTMTFIWGHSPDITLMRDLWNKSVEYESYINRFMRNDLEKETALKDSKPLKQKIHIYAKLGITMVLIDWQQESTMY